MTAADLFHDAKLREAIDAQIAKVKNSPTDKAARFFLFELFLFSGELDRARKQLELLNYDDPQHSAAIMQYRNALESETRRRAVFAGKEQPKGLVDAPDHVKFRLESVERFAAGDYASARAKLDQANDAVPTVSGVLDGRPFSALYDADERFGTVIEVFGMGGLYSWVPLENIVNLIMNPPATPRDVIYRPAHIILTDGLEGDVLLPAIYPGSYDQADDHLRLGRATEWLEGDIVRGVGGRVFLTADGEKPMNGILQILRPEAAPAS